MWEGGAAVINAGRAHGTPAALLEFISHCDGLHGNEPRVGRTTTFICSAALVCGDVIPKSLRQLMNADNIDFTCRLSIQGGRLERPLGMAVGEPLHERGKSKRITAGWISGFLQADCMMDTMRLSGWSLLGEGGGCVCCRCV